MSRFSEIKDAIDLAFIQDAELKSSQDNISHLQLLVDNDLGSRLSGSCYTFNKYDIDLRVIVKFMCDKSKDLRQYLTDTESTSAMVNSRYNEIRTNLDNKELSKLSKYIFPIGIYYLQLDDKGRGNYIVLHITQQEGKYSSANVDIDFTLYTIGKKHRKYMQDIIHLIYDTKKRADIFEEDDKILHSTKGANTSSYIKFRSFDSLIMEKKDEVIQYLSNWVSNIPKYEKYGMIPKLSILLYGDPGTGKTTFCQALANYLGIHSIMVVDPNYFTDSEQWHLGGGRYIDGLRGTIYSINDIDCICHRRDDKEKNDDNDMILQKLLSFLDSPEPFYYKAKDGIWYPIQVVVATTNCYDELDPAVVRYGRFDLKIQMNEFKRTEAEKMCEFYDLKLDDVLPNFDWENKRVQPAYLQAKCFEKFDSSMKGSSKKKKKHK